jgi:hypothetical protein
MNVFSCEMILSYGKVANLILHVLGLTITSQQLSAETQREENKK